MLHQEYVKSLHSHSGDQLPETRMKAAERVGEDAPNLISKKWLCDHYNISHHNPNGLYRNVLTPDVLEQLGLSTETVRTRSFKMFSATDSRKLKQILFG